MKPTVKIASLLLAVLMLFSVCAAGCSFQKEWSYKTDAQELAIGVYLTAMQEAYSEAQGYAQSVDGYDASSDKWLDLEITDSEGNKKVAKDWIKEPTRRPLHSSKKPMRPSGTAPARQRSRSTAFRWRALSTMSPTTPV